MAIWDDYGMTEEEYEAFTREYSDYLTETGQNEPFSDADIEAMMQDDIARGVDHFGGMPDTMGVEDSFQHVDGVEDNASYERRMQHEAELFKNMPFEQILQYRIKREMALTDADKALVNEKISAEWGEMVDEHDTAMQIYDAEYDDAEVKIARYEADEDAQRLVRGCNGNVPAYMIYDYPVDSTGRTLSVEEVQADVEARRAANTQAFESARDKFFGRVYDFHELTTSPWELPPSVTDGYIAAPTITPQTFSELGTDYDEYSARRLYEQTTGKQMSNEMYQAAAAAMPGKDVSDMSIDSELDLLPDDDLLPEPEPVAQPVGLPVVDFSRPVVADKSGEKQSQTQETLDKQGTHADNYKQDAAQRDQQVDDNETVHKNRNGLAGFEGNSIEHGRSNPDYDFDEYD